MKTLVFWVVELFLAKWASCDAPVLISLAVATRLWFLICSHVKDDCAMLQTIITNIFKRIIRLSLKIDSESFAAIQLLLFLLAYVRDL